MSKYLVLDHHEGYFQYEFFNSKTEAINFVREIVTSERESLLEKFKVYECTPIKLGITKYVEEIEEIQDYTDL